LRSWCIRGLVGCCLCLVERAGHVQQLLGADAHLQLQLRVTLRELLVLCLQCAQQGLVGATCATPGGRTRGGTKGSGCCYNRASSAPSRAAARGVSPADHSPAL
jgi:hypothetical protein